MANYKPRNINVTTASTKSGIINVANVLTSAWALALIKGSALAPSGSVLASGAILLWSAGHSADSASPDYTTFTDGLGQFGITVKANTAYVIKFYSK